MALTKDQKEYLLALIEEKKQLLRQNGGENSESYSRLTELAAEIKEEK